MISSVLLWTGSVLLAVLGLAIALCVVDFSSDG